MLLIALRIALYAQLALGLSRLFGASFAFDRRIWDLHILLALIIVVLALIALRPMDRVPQTALRAAARFAPLLPLLLGVGFLAGVLPRSPAIVGVHALLGLATIGLVEMSSARQRRALRQATATQG